MLEPTGGTGAHRAATSTRGTLGEDDAAGHEGFRCRQSTCDPCARTATCQSRKRILHKSPLQHLQSATEHRPVDAHVMHRGLLTQDMCVLQVRERGDRIAARIEMRCGVEFGLDARMNSKGEGRSEAHRRSREEVACLNAIVPAMREIDLNKSADLAECVGQRFVVRVLRPMACRSSMPCRRELDRGLA